ncbi:MAG: hypothetical protein JO020_03675 [Chloroflexi bacterium]|nr:hypothetical protein [Chloroflexota bacterium]MBV9893250.1 hypothetical protein [Chloroflexota bacterium]
MEVANGVVVFVRSLTLFLVLTLTAGSATSAFAQATATPAATATATPVGCVNPTSGVHIELENPAPGDTLMTGTQVVINGIAFDTGSTSGPGISSVSVYLGPRDAGGLFLGTAILGQANPNVPSSSQFATAGFTLRTPALPAGNGGRSIDVYARSLVGNAEGTLEVPIFLNAAPTPVRGQVPTAVVPPPPTCTPTPTPAATATATPVPPPAAPTAPPTATRSSLFATSTPIPLAPAPAPAAPAAPPAAAPAPAAAAPAAVSPATAQTTAPRGGGIPSELGLLILAVGSVVVGGGLALRRRERRR